MRIYDISREIFSGTVYPGDTVPTARAVRRTAAGDLYNLTDICMCAHNATHVDAPFHFFGEGKTVDEIDLQKVVGYCFLTRFSGRMEADGARKILSDAVAAGGKEAARRILVAGDVTVTAEAAAVFSKAEIDLVGVESQSVGEQNAPMEVHKILLEKEVVLLEGLRLTEVPTGCYLLSAAPLYFAGIDGAPCRALLIEM